MIPPCRVQWQSPRSSSYLKVFKLCVRYVLASLFFNSKRAFMKQGKTFFISIQKLFFFLLRSNFRFSYIKSLWCHQIPKHNIRNTFNWITWEVYTVWSWNLVAYVIFQKKKKVLFCNISYVSQISLPDCHYSSSYSVKCVSSFMLRYLVRWWDFKIWKVKIWLSQDQKELSKWN